MHIQNNTYDNYDIDIWSHDDNDDYDNFMFKRNANIMRINLLNGDNNDDDNDDYNDTFMYKRNVNIIRIISLNDDNNYINSDIIYWYIFIYFKSNLFDTY